MALNLSNKYPGRANPPSIDYPEGSIKNQTAPGAKDGTPLDADWANDKEGFFQSILNKAGVIANGLVDKVGESQYFDALETGFKSSSDEIIDGTNDDKFITPKGFKDAGFWPLGVGQSYQNVSASRVEGVTYTNTTGRPIFVCVIRRNSSDSFETGGYLTVNGAVVSELRVDNEDAVATATLFAIVPTGATYAFNGYGSTQTTTWMELR